MNKKAMDLSIQTIVVAIIALIVLGVVIFIFYDQIKAVADGFKRTREGAQVCQTGFLGGQKCVLPENCKEVDGWEPVPGRCEEEGYVCCEKKSEKK